VLWEIRRSGWGGNGSRGLGKGRIGFYTISWARSRVDFIRRDWAGWAVLWGGTVDWFQSSYRRCWWWLGSVRTCAVSVQERSESSVLGSSRSARGQGMGGATTCARCRARSCASRGQCACVCTGMRVALSVSTGVRCTVRTRVTAGPIAGLVGRQRLGGEGGGVWGSMARELPLASFLCLSPTSMPWVH
jgi:hypothetical protein